MPIRILSLILFLSAIYACGNQQAKKNQTTTKNKGVKTESAPFALTSPSSDSKINWEETLNIAFKPTNDSIKIDSSSLTINGTAFASQLEEPSYTWVVPKIQKLGIRLFLLPFGMMEERVLN
ncbi:MAG: hypothetical protein LBG19_00845 [Prevotellaceae bacterium]|jgi:hypothetical protein|nr:hypothetical protein [Prevotellaceae bacterium]